MFLDGLFSDQNKNNISCERAKSEGHDVLVTL